MIKQQALELLHAHTKNDNLRRHMYAVGYAMRALAEKLGGDPDMWELLGILHDADWEETKNTPDEHTKRTLEWIAETDLKGTPVEHALKSHNSKRTKLAELDGLMEWSLETVDELTGFIVAVALMRPDPPSHEASDGQAKSSKLLSTDLHSVLKKWKRKEFAAAVSREQIAQCEEKLGIPLPDFIELTLKAMQVHHEELGL